MVTVVLLLLVCRMDGYELWDLESHKAPLKAAGSEVLSYCSSSTDTFFYSQCAVTG